MGRFVLGLGEAAAFCFGGWITEASTYRRGIGESCTPYVLQSIVFSPIRLVFKSHTIECATKLSKQWGKRASWSEEVDSKEFRGALDEESNLEPRGSPFSGHPLPILLHRLQCGMLILKYSPCTAVHYQTVSLS